MINPMFRICKILPHIYTIVYLFFGLLDVNYAQLQSAEPYFGYSVSISKRLDVNDADAVGGGVKIQFNFYDNLALRINVGYKLYSISQKDAIEKWEWFFWDERYANTIQSNLNAFSELSAEIGSIQKMDVIPVLIDFNYPIKLNDELSLIPFIGGGIHFYTRRLYITESWTKHFEEIDYNFNYTYRNFPPDKSGNPIQLFTGFEFNYNLFEFFHLRSEINYGRFISSEDSFGFSDLPINDELNINFGVYIIY